MRLDENRKEVLEQATVRVLLAIRARYLAEGANALKHWDQLHDRMRSAIEEVKHKTVAAWFTRLAETLDIQVTSSISSVVAELEAEVQTTERSAWANMVREEHAMLIALAQKEAEARKAARAVDVDPETGEVLNA